MHAFLFCAHRRRRGWCNRQPGPVGALSWTRLQGWWTWASFNYWKLRAPIIPALYIYIYIYITPGCIQYRECTQAEPTRQEHLVRANRPIQAEPTLRLRSSRTLPTECYNFRTRPAVASSYIEIAITSDQQLQSYFFNKISQSYSVLAITSEQLSSCIHTSSCNHFVYIFLTDIWVELYSSCNHT
jgi:hypothetical protein